MIIEVARAATQLGSAFGVGTIVTTALPKVIPEGASTATKVCCGIAELGITGAVAIKTGEYFDRLFNEMEEFVLDAKGRKVIKEIRKQQLEKLEKAESAEEVIGIIEETSDKVEEVKNQIKEEAEFKKECKEHTLELKKRAGTKLFSKANKKLAEMGVKEARIVETKPWTIKNIEK